MRVSIDPDVCQGHTLCHMAAPALFQLRDEDGHAYVVVDEVPPELEELARKAMLTCPEGAISIT
jgi:ferredoxin